jgi:hypothetical protein
MRGASSLRTHTRPSAPTNERRRAAATFERAFALLRARRPPPWPPPSPPLVRRSTLDLRFLTRSRVRGRGGNDLVSLVKCKVAAAAGSSGAAMRAIQHGSFFFFLALREREARSRKENKGAARGRAGERRNRKKKGAIERGGRKTNPSRGGGCLRGANLSFWALGLGSTCAKRGNKKNNEARG